MGSAGPSTRAARVWWRTIRRERTGQAGLSDRHGAVLVNESGCSPFREERQVHTGGSGLGCCCAERRVARSGHRSPEGARAGHRAACALGCDGSSAASSPPPPPCSTPESPTSRRAASRARRVLPAAWTAVWSAPRGDAEHELPVRCGTEMGGGGRGCRRRALFTRRLALSGSILGPMQFGCGKSGRGKSPSTTLPVWWFSTAMMARCVSPGSPANPSGGIPSEERPVRDRGKGGVDG